MKLIRVKQEHKNGCAPACIATLTGLSYKEALRAIYPWKKIKRWDYYGTRFSHILRALKKIGIKYKKRKPTLFSNIHFNSIILTDHPIYGGYHVVVWDCMQQIILDPYVGYHRNGLKKHLPRKSYEKYCLSIIEVNI
jgi:hypothetical protein